MQSTVAPEPRTVELPMLDLRAAVSSIDEGARTAELIFSTGAPVERMDWMSGERYVERLSLAPEAVKTDRLNAGAPLLNSHDAFELNSIIGAVVPGSVRLAKDARVTVKFSQRAEVEPIWQDVRDGIIRSVSVGYRTFAYEETPAKGKNPLPTRTATSWEPMEVSLVAIPADPGARVRDGKQGETNRCVITPTESTVAPAAEPAAPASKEKTVDNETRAESFVADLTLPAAPAPAAPAEPTETERGIAVERDRINGIETACRVHRMPVALRDELVNTGVALEVALVRVNKEVQKRGGDNYPSRIPGGDPRVEVTGTDPAVHVREGIVEAICHKAHPRDVVRERAFAKDGTAYMAERNVGFELTEKGRPYMEMSLLRIAERMLLAKRVDAGRLSDSQIVEMSMRGGGQHSTSDFPLLLADVANKTLRAGYEEAPQTFGPITRRVTAPDFKDMKRNQFGEAPALSKVNEGGEITSGTISEAREVYAVDTYAVIFPVSRKAIVNDDLRAFTRVPMDLGKQARNKESDLVWQQLTANAAMGDGQNLFSAAHANWDNSGAVIDVESIGAGRAAMRVQKGLDGSTLLNITPRFLIVPAALETLADQFVAQITPNNAGQVNPFGVSGRMPLTVIAEARLDSASTQIWYLAASLAEFGDIIELATLSGQNGPRLEQEMGFEIEGVKFKVVHDIGAKVIDYRGLYRNAGVTLT